MNFTFSSMLGLCVSFSRYGSYRFCFGRGSLDMSVMSGNILIDLLKDYKEQSSIRIRKKILGVFCSN